MRSCEGGCWWGYYLAKNIIVGGNMQAGSLGAKFEVKIFLIFSVGREGVERRVILDLEIANQAKRNRKA